MIASIRAITPAIAFGRFPGAGASTNLAFSFAEGQPAADRRI
jgi:hypothetical protein